MIVNRLPQADHVIVLGKEGQILEQDTFSNLSISGSYVQSLGINQIGEQPTKGSDDQSDVGKVSVSRRTQNPEAASEENRKTGDWAVYKYYTASLGWLSLFVFATFIASNSTFGALQCGFRLCFF
jgi:ATP-binding cassette, subfamily C (CFTR/MRP), member 1